MDDTRVTYEEKLVCDGMTFQWWAVGGCPALVTVRSPVLGSLRDFTVGDVKQFAMSLARKLLYTETEQTPAKGSAQAVDAESSTSSFQKPGWFE